MPSLPGMVGTPAAFMVALAEALSPMASIISGEAPMNLMSFSPHTLENWAFSERKPYPGWMASALVISAAAMMFGMLR